MPVCMFLTIKRCTLTPLILLFIWLARSVKTLAMGTRAI